MKSAFAIVVVACACGSSPAASDAGTDASNPVDAAADASPGSAAEATANSNALCTAIAPFYWEIGDVNGAIVSGTTGSGLIKETTQLNIASASKLWWGAYVVERFKANLAQIDLPSMEMQNGRSNFADCTTTTTIDACCAKTGTAGGATTNCDIVPADVGYFFYSGGDFEGYAQTLTLGADDDAALATEYQNLLGTELSFSFTQPQPAGGMKMPAATYTQFLRKILAGTLAIHDHLGENAVCTLPSACPMSHYSPSPLAWHYSYGHWVEDEPTTGDGAFSSPGKFGFYPWIDQTKTHYGVVAREDLTPGTSIQTAPYYQSVLCGRAIRKAFMTGVAQ